MNFNEPDYDVVEIVDVDYQKQVIAQNQINKEVRQRFVDINDEAEPGLRTPAQARKSHKNISSFENSYKQFQKHYENEISEDY